MSLTEKFHLVCQDSGITPNSQRSMKGKPCPNAPGVSEFYIVPIHVTHTLPPTPSVLLYLGLSVEGLTPAKHPQGQLFAAKQLSILWTGLARRGQADGTCVGPLGVSALF